MDYKRSTIASLLRRLRQYGGYVGCGCYDRVGEDCEGQPNCAQADYMQALAALRKLLLAGTR